MLANFLFLLFSCSIASIVIQGLPIFTKKNDLKDMLDKVKIKASKESAAIREVLKKGRSPVSGVVADVCPSDSEIDCSGACVTQGSMLFEQKKPAGCTEALCVRADYDPLACDNKCYPQGTTRPHRIGVDASHADGHCLMPGKTIPDTVLDDCMVFWGDGSSCRDCKGVKGGSSMDDACGVCEGKGDTCGVKIEKVMHDTVMADSQLSILAGTDKGAAVKNIKCIFTSADQKTVETAASALEQGVLKCPTPSTQGTWDLSINVTKGAKEMQATFKDKIKTLTTQGLKIEKMMAPLLTEDFEPPRLRMKVASGFAADIAKLGIKTDPNCKKNCDTGMRCIVKGLDGDETRSFPAAFTDAKKTMVSCDLADIDDNIEDVGADVQVALSFDDGEATAGPWSAVTIPPTVPTPTITPLSGDEFMISFDEEVDTTKLKGCNDMFSAAMKCKLGKNPKCQFVNSQQMLLKLDTALAKGCTAKTKMSLDQKITFKDKVIRKPGQDTKKALPTVHLDFSKLIAETEATNTMWPKIPMLRGPKTIRNCGSAQFGTDAVLQSNSIKWSIKKNGKAVALKDVTVANSDGTGGELGLNLAKFAAGDKVELTAESESLMGASAATHELTLTDVNVPMVQITTSQNPNNVDVEKGLLIGSKVEPHACSAKEEAALLDKKVLYNWAMVNSKNKVLKQLGDTSELWLDPNVLATEDVRIQVQAWYEGMDAKAEDFVDIKPRKMMRIRKSVGDRMILSQQSSSPLELNAKSMMKDNKFNLGSAQSTAVSGVRWSCKVISMADSVADMMHNKAMASMSQLQDSLARVENLNHLYERGVRKKRSAKMISKKGKRMPAALMELMNIKPVTSPCYDSNDNLFPSSNERTTDDLKFDPKSMPVGYYQLKMEGLLPDGTAMAEKNFDIEVVKESIPKIEFLPVSSDRPSSDHPLTVSAMIEQCGMGQPPDSSMFKLKTLDPEHMAQPCEDMHDDSSSEEGDQGSGQSEEGSGSGSGTDGDSEEDMEGADDSDEDMKKRKKRSPEDLRGKMKMHMHNMDKEAKNRMSNLMASFPDLPHGAPKLLETVDLENAMNTEGRLFMDTEKAGKGCYKTRISQVIRKGILKPNREYAFAICAKDGKSGKVAENIQHIFTAAKMDSAQVNVPKECTLLDKMQISVGSLQGASGDSLSDMTYEFGTVEDDHFSPLTPPTLQPSASVPCIQSANSRLRYGVQICMEEGSSCSVFSSAADTVIKSVSMTPAQFAAKKDSLVKKAQSFGQSFESIVELKSLKEVAVEAKRSMKVAKDQMAMDKVISDTHLAIVQLVNDTLHNKHIDGQRMAHIAKIMENDMQTLSSKAPNYVESIGKKMKEHLDMNVALGDMRLTPEQVSSVSNLMAKLPAADMMAQKNALRLMDLSRLEIGAGPQQINDFGGKIRGRIRKDFLKGKEFKSSDFGSTVMFPDALADSIGACGIETSEVKKADRDLLLDSKEKVEMASDFVDILLRDIKTGSEYAVEDAGGKIKLSIPVETKAGKKPVCKTIDTNRRVSSLGMETAAVQEGMLQCTSTHLSTFFAVHMDDANNNNNNNNNGGVTSKPKPGHNHKNFALAFCPVNGVMLVLLAVVISFIGLI